MPQGRLSNKEKAQWVGWWRASGLSAFVFAARHGLAVSSLYAWRKKVEQDQADKGKRHHFTEVRVRGEVSQYRHPLEVVLPNGLMVRVGKDVDRERLRAVLEVARSC